MKKILCAIGCATCIAACSNGSMQKNSNSSNLKKISFADTELSIPSELILRPSAELNEHQVIDNDLNKNDLDKPEEYRIELTAISKHCSPVITGTSKSIVTSNTNGQTSWGKIDFWNHGMDYEPGTEPVCRPAGGPSGTGYALCSEKDGKTVVICISQMTDNPKLAEDIFKTFRWTK